MSLQLKQRSSLQSLHRDDWDVIVIGAGVAGSSFAIEVAKRDKSVLLVEAERFPRDKVCGGCLNPRAQTHLSDLGVLKKVQDAGAVHLNGIHIYTGKRSVQWTTPPMLSVRRSTLDAILVERAMELGATFVDGVRGRVSKALEINSGTLPEVHFDDGNTQTASRANIVVVAAGLTRSPIAQDSSWPKWIDPTSRIGASVLINGELHPQLHRELYDLIRSIDSIERLDQLHMLSGRAGYVGICQTDANCIDVATAIDPGQIKGQNGITIAVQSIFDECKFQCSLKEDSLVWNATSALTRRSSIAAKDRVFLLGDSLGYVEPFTGEGMSWAMSAASQLAVLVDQFSVQEIALMETRWNQWMNTHRSSRQSIARWVAKLARNRVSSNWMLSFLNYTRILRDMLLRKAMQ